MADHFRPDVEGLRAVAVALVLLYHAGVPGAAGGFVGVDVFFVISGFLITGLLLRELRSTGTVSLPTFYARRARRLLPAAMVALGVTMAVSAVVLPPLLVPDVAGDVASSALYVGNIHFALGATDYLQAESAPSPVLHFWSLGVEEQFYLFWPALLLLAATARRFGGTVERRLGVVVLAVLGGSLALSFWLTDVDQPWAFFSLPTRAWELAIGALLALGAARLARMPAAAAAAVGWLGLGLIAVAAVSIDAATPFPGSAALVPVVGAALVVAAGLRTTTSLPGRLLSAGPMRWLGRISYSLYLWHWPIIVLPALALGTELPLAVRIALAILAIPVAAASQRWIEEPIRHGRFGRIPTRRTLALAGSLSLAVAAGSLVVGAAAVPATAADGGGALVADDGGTPMPSLPPAPTPATSAVASSAPSGMPAPSASDDPAETPTPSASAGVALVGGPLPRDLLPPLAKARDDKPVVYVDGCHLAALDTSSPSCTYGAVGSATEVVLLGDSHAAQWFPTFERLAERRGWRLVSLTKSACPAVDVTVWNGTLRREYRECDTWRAAALARIAADRPALVVLASSRVATLIVDGRRVDATADPTTWRAGLERMLRQLRTAAGAVVVIGDTPRSAFDPPVCLSRHANDVLACATPRDQATDVSWLSMEAGAAAVAGATFVDPTDLLCGETACPAVIGRFLVQRDEHHLTTPFAASLAGPIEDLLPTIP